MKHLGIKEIEEILPHRHPFLLIDYIEDYEPGEFAAGYKCVTFHEDFFRGHFPQEPVMPGVLIVEALAQTGAVAILSKEENKGKTAYFGRRMHGRRQVQLGRMPLHRRVRPGPCHDDQRRCIRPPDGRRTRRDPGKILSLYLC